jgi:protein-S-isoprenylcysteine O-methyltransferase Ste14
MWRYFILFSVAAIVGMGSVFTASFFPDYYYVPWIVFGVIFLSLGMIGLGMWWQERSRKKIE